MGITESRLISAGDSIAIQGGGGSSVSCGGHTAPSCADCPQGNGADWCNGACTWDHSQGTCKGKKGHNLPKFCSVESVTQKVSCQLDLPSETSWFQLVDFPDGWQALWHTKSRKYCGDGGEYLLCNKDAVGGSEKYHFKKLSPGQVAFYTGKDSKWCANEASRIKCNRDRLALNTGSLEKFKIYIK